MAKGSKGGYYAVRVGRKPGVYATWDECKAQVDGVQGARHKKFPTLRDAQAFVGGGAPPVPSATGGSGNAASGSGFLDSRKKRGSDAADRPSTAAKRQKRAVVGNAGADPVFGASPAIKGRKVYCDGSSRGNGQKGATAGIGVFWGHEPGASNLSERLPGSLQTNNRAEMYAVARILESDPHPDEPLTICSDSEYTIGVFSKWIPGWKRRGWKTSDGKPVANQDLIRYILSLLALRMPADSTSPLANITFHKVKAHVGIEGNEQADRFANNGALMPEVAERDFAAATRDNERNLRTRASGGAAVSRVEDVEWSVEIEEGDLLDEEELKALERTQEF
ncbi:RNA-DNA hybrid ribonuclease [Rhodotorula paludigena]|uniref:RNA-DNA hybrid ribonuclease n=1 Tax=Rhodotorula paludigena TaxID=86838 RepID=UPI00317822C8